MALLIKNGDIVNADGRLTADILVENDTITRIGQGLQAPPGAEVINARGRYVFPGFIDPHVHVYLPFMGTYAKDTYKTASKAAVVGGTTTLIEMCCPGNNDPVLDSYHLWRSKAEGNSACDFTFHMGVTRFDKKSEQELRKIVADGIASFKIFLAYKGALGVNDEQLFNVMKLAKELGVIVTAHCENAELVAQMQARLIGEGKTAPKWHYHSRPPMVEAEGVHHLATFAAMHGTHVYTVHTSCRESVTAALRARERGVNIWIETLIQYLTLDMTHAEKGGFDKASRYVMSPPLRHKSNQEFLWHGLRQGFINTLATDHAPFDVKKQKPMGTDDFTKIPNGIPSLEDRMTVFWTEGVCKGRIDLHRFVDCASTETAKIFGLFPRKGTVSVGADADLVIWDPKYRGKISVRKQHMNVDYNPFEGWEIRGRPAVVTVRGRVVARDGTFVGKLGHGQLIQREPTHF